MGPSKCIVYVEETWLDSGYTTKITLEKILQPTTM